MAGVVMWLQKKMVPTLLTGARFVFGGAAVMSVLQEQYMLATALYVVAWLSDLVDGWMARRFDVVTERGARLDSLGDQLLMVGMFAALMVAGRIPRVSLVFAVLPAVYLVAAGYAVKRYGWGVYREMVASHTSPRRRFGGCAYFFLFLAVVGWFPPMVVGVAFLCLAYYLIRIFSAEHNRLQRLAEEV